MNDPENKNSFITREEYEECGPEYLKEHRCSNLIINKPNYNITINKNFDNIKKNSSSEN